MPQRAGERRQQAEADERRERADVERAPVDLGDRVACEVVACRDLVGREAALAGLRPVRSLLRDRVLVAAQTDTLAPEALPATPGGR